MSFHPLIPPIETFPINLFWNIKNITKTGNKTVTLEREGVKTNIINRLISGSTWLSLREGENNFYLRASEGLTNLKVKIIHINAYLGV